MTAKIDPSALLAQARSAMTGAYAPYSSFCVGAALLLSDGQVVTGANVENASYGLAMCAERVAIGTAVAAGKQHFVAIAIAANEASPCTPCGACRQVLAEFAPDVEVILESADGSPWVLGLQELLPHQFAFDSLVARKG